MLEIPKYALLTFSPDEILILSPPFAEPKGGLSISSPAFKYLVLYITNGGVAFEYSLMM